MVASLVAVRLFDEWFSFLPAGSLEPLRIDLDLTYEQLSVLLVLMTVGGLAGGVCAVAADRVSRRAQSSLGALGYAVSMACWGLGDRFWILAAGSFLLGVSSDALLSACEVALVDLAGDHDLVTVLAPGTIAAEVGDLLGPLLLALTAAIGWGYRAPFLVGAVVLLVYAVVLALQPPAATDGDRGADDGPGRRLGLPPRPAGLAARADLAALRHAGRAAPRLRHRLPRGRPGPAARRGRPGRRERGRGRHRRCGGHGRTRRRRSAASGGRNARPSAGAALALAVSVLGIMVAPLIPLQVLFGLTTGMASAIFWTRCRPGSSDCARASPARRPRSSATWPCPARLVPLVAAAAADRLGLGAALAVYVGVAMLLTAVTALSGRSRPAPIVRDRSVHLRFRKSELQRHTSAERRRGTPGPDDQRPPEATCSSAMPPSTMR